MSRSRTAGRSRFSQLVGASGDCDAKQAIQDALIIMHPNTRLEYIMRSVAEVFQSPVFGPLRF
jgi:hypothetical protein